MSMASKTLQVAGGQEELDASARVFQWNRILMKTLGLWPATQSDLWFGINFGYFCYQMILEYLDLFLFIDNLEHVVMNLTENMAFSQIFIRMLMLRLYNAPLGKIIEEAMKDFDTKDYVGEEITTFTAYHKKSIIFMKLLMSNTALTASSYYVKPLLGQLGDVIAYLEGGNASFIYVLPYRFHTFYELDAKSYFWTYGSQLPFVFVSGFGQSAADCLMVTLVYHVSGQMAVLATRITKLDTESINCSSELRRLVQSHIRLLTMGQMIQDAFSATLLGHLIGATSLVCILGYQILLCLAIGESAILVSFFAFIFLVLLVLYAHCTVGESLITESNRVCEAYYNCKWYNMSQKDDKLVMFGIARSQKPMMLTAGKFSMFCLATLTSVSLSETLAVACLECTRSLKRDLLFQRELNSAEMVFHWSLRLFSLLGINPLNFNDPLFTIVLLYSILHLILSCADLPNSMGSNLSVIVDAITEIGSMVTVLTKLLVYKWQRSELAAIMSDILKDYAIGEYSSVLEVHIFVDYVLKAKTFFRIFVSFGTTASVCYYLRCFVISGIGIPMITDSSNTTKYLLPYRMRFYYPLVNARLYISAMVYVLPVIPITAFTMVADAVLLFALLAHLCGQLSVLSRCSLRRLADDAGEFRRSAAVAIAKHNRLIRIAKAIDSAFNLLLLQQVMGITFFLCMVGYNSLMNWDSRETITENILMLTLGALAANMTFLLFAYCYAGQCLIDESLYLFDAVYDSCWYKLGSADMKYLVMFLNQTRRPLAITGGRFYVYSLQNFLSLYSLSTMTRLWWCYVSDGDALKL
ncbi:uncharacterized protein LOC131674683 [Phymastichus coffea]|uniref:uncharacterized protein LOC131674683 n=1 Tax=Phymastichus coffea TaxID=108790 RepID=UPI00273CE386|nr:uncharacterized protein LOC131674683 [Phymastichus coffea]